MQPELKTGFFIDPDIESYKSFFDHDWIQKLFKLVEGTKLEEIVFLLGINWKATANAQFMPWLMVNKIRAMWKGYMHPQETFTSQMIKAIVEMVPNMLEEHVSKTVARKVMKQIRPKVLARMKEGEESAQAAEHPLMIPQNMFSFFLNGEGSSEMHFSIFGVQRICYGTLFHEYENFVKQCVSLAKKDPDYWTSRWKDLVKDVKAEFGADIGKYCTEDQPVETGRLIRNCLAHGGGKLTQEMKDALPKGTYEEHDGFVRIAPKHNRRLFNDLKERVMKLAEKAITLPHLAK